MQKLTRCCPLLISFRYFERSYALSLGGNLESNTGAAADSQQSPNAETRSSPSAPKDDAPTAQATDEDAEMEDLLREAARAEEQRETDADEEEAMMAVES